MSIALKITKVETPADFKVFLGLPWQVYKDQPNWTPPLVSMRRDTLDKTHNPAWDYMEGDYFIAWRGAQAVGGIAAFINHRHNEFHNENIGWFGAFEVLNDPEAATALLTTAVDWVRAKGCTAIRGPQTFTTHEDVGLLVDGFAPPVILMPYHAPYYQVMIESQGFTKRNDMYSFYSDWAMLGAGDLESKFEKLKARIIQRSGLTIRPIDRKNLRADFVLFKDLYNKAWVANWGFVPMTDKELDALIAGLQLIFDPDLACFAEINGVPVGFLIVIPDLNQALHLVRPNPNIPEPLSLLSLVWHWKLRGKVTGSRVPLMGVVSEHRSKGFDLVMHYHVLGALRRKGYAWVDCGWILDANHDMIGVMKGYGMRVHRTYRLYERSLQPS
ncbi:MAG: hypothetical protein H7Y11_01960 [Armatimonadetes bacterium]|nr:hypothetical protein [Anaerolineae bacterium]